MASCIAPVRRWATVIRDFLTTGQLIDLAVAIVIGDAFTKVVKSLVDNLLTPVFGFLFNGIAIANLQATLKSDRWSDKPPVIVPYGKFLQELIGFASLAIVLSISIMIINKIRTTQRRNQINPQDKPTRQELILMEHTNLLKTIAQSLKE